MRIGLNVKQIASNVIIWSAVLFTYAAELRLRKTNTPATALTASF